MTQQPRNGAAAPDPDLLPSAQTLARASAAAVALAALLLVTVILPAEAGIDPTGVGSWLGLTQLGELKNGAVEGADEATVPAQAQAQAQATAQPPAPEPVAYSFRKDELTLTLQPNEGKEIKAVMREGDQLMYTWTADQGELFFDFHGEPKGAAANVFTSFEKGTQTTAEGGFEAPFEGTHGWYWKNKTSQPVTLTLQTSGVYADIARK